MGIKFNCSECNAALNVKAKLAGLRGICPICKKKIQIPKRSAVADALAASADTDIHQEVGQRREAGQQPDKGQLSPPAPGSANEGTSVVTATQNSAKKVQKPASKSRNTATQPKSSQTGPKSKTGKGQATPGKNNSTGPANTTQKKQGAAAAKPPKQLKPGAKTNSAAGANRAVDDGLAPKPIQTPVAEKKSPSEIDPAKPLPTADIVEAVEQVEVFETNRSTYNSAAATASVSDVSGDQRQPVATEPVVEALPVKDQAPPTSGSEQAVRDPLADAPNAVWYVRPPGGGQFGPASADLMKQWIGEGRIGAHSLVWREGWADWLIAQNVFAQLSDEKSNPPTVLASASNAPFTAAQPSVVDPDAANKKKLDYYRTKKRKATCGIVVIFVGVMIIAALGVLLAIVIGQS